MKLRDLAHARTGDKGNISNISVIAYNPEDFDYLARELDEQRIADVFSSIVQGGVKRYDLPQLGAFNFVLSQALGGGVTRSVALDAHGKSLSAYLLDLDLAER